MTLLVFSSCAVKACDDSNNYKEREGGDGGGGGGERKDTHIQMWLLSCKWIFLNDKNFNSQIFLIKL